MLLIVQVQVLPGISQGVNEGFGGRGGLVYHTWNSKSFDTFSKNALNVFVKMNP